MLGEYGHSEAKSGDEPLITAVLINELGPRQYCDTSAMLQARAVRLATPVADGPIAIC